jgi:osmotically inducible protein OsmC
MAAIRRADATWIGSLVEGSGTVSASSSAAFSDLPVSWASRTEESNGRTSPEELVAAAHAACYSMAFSGGLARNGTPAERLDVRGTVTFVRGAAAGTVASSALPVRGRVPGIDGATFERLADEARDGCPISRAIKGNVAVSVEATLVS